MNGSRITDRKLTFDDDDLTVDDSNSERAVFHHVWFLRGSITRDVHGRKLSIEKHLGITKPLRRSAALAYS